jgi:hypothetical protein
MTEIELDPNLLVTLQTLESHAVDYVLIGEIAEAIHNRGGCISGLAIVPGSYGRNVDRLASALQALDAHTSNGMPIDYRVLDLRAAAPCTLTTRYADVHLDFAPGATNGYRDLFDDAARHTLAPGVSPHVAAPEDLERIDEWRRASSGALPAAVAPAALPPEPPDVDADIPPARAPAVLPPGIDDFAAEIRASQSMRR